jgi:hypothetical protein
MRFLRSNTAVRVTVGPFMDKADGVTPETALTVTSCKLTLMVDDGNVPTLALDASATASGGSNDMVHVTNDDAGFYDLELTAANLNYVGRAMLAITDAATHCPVFHEFMILPAMVYDALVLGTDTLQADVTQWLGTAAATPTTAGVPEVDVTHWLGTAAAAPTVAGVPEVDATHFGGSAGTFSSGRPEVNASHVYGVSAEKLGAHLPAILKLVVDAGSSTTTVVFKTVDGGAASATNDFYNGRVIVFTSGTLAGQATSISDYVGATVTATVVALTGTPAEDVTAVIV